MIIEPANISSSNVRAFFTTRHFAGSYDHITDAVAHNLKISKDNIYLPVQKHTDRIQVYEPDGETEVADAVITNSRQILIGVLVADCVPILIYDRTKGVAGAVHAGWRGTAKQILRNALDIMCRRFHCNPGDISVAIGPSIRGCSYEVGEAVVSEVQEATGKGDYYSEMHGKYYVDLSSANKIQTLSMGIPEGNIWQSEDCTFCNPQKYYSYRYSGGSTGRQGGFIGMW